MEATGKGFRDENLLQKQFVRAIKASRIYSIVILAIDTKQCVTNTELAVDQPNLYSHATSLHKNKEGKASSHRVNMQQICVKSVNPMKWSEFGWITYMHIDYTRYLWI